MAATAIEMTANRCPLPTTSSRLRPGRVNGLAAHPPAAAETALRSSSVRSDFRDHHRCLPTEAGSGELTDADSGPAQSKWPRSGDRFDKCELQDSDRDMNRLLGETAGAFRISSPNRRGSTVNS